jgi:electron transfer flavoprotein alpha/beta subunit
MKIVACIKYSLDVSEVKVDPATKQLRLSGVPLRVGNIDRNVLEAAIGLVEQHGGTVHGLTLAPATARESFRESIAMGLEDLTIVDSAALPAAEPAVTAAVLAGAIEKIGDVDLVICGETSDDGVSYQVPPRLAERLGRPLLGYARNIEFSDGCLRADRDLDSGMQRAQTPLPAVMTVTQETNTPRRPTLMDAVKAKKKTVNVWQPGADLGLADDALAARATVHRVEQAGIVVQRKQKMLDGDVATMANQLIDALVADQVVKEG